jgi:ribosome biogenesis GTPase / thiamine phosphate phosphatase
MLEGPPRTGDTVPEPAPPTDPSTAPLVALGWDERVRALYADLEAAAGGAASDSGAASGSGTASDFGTADGGTADSGTADGGTAAGGRGRVLRDRVVPGRVVRVERSACVVITAGGDRMATAPVLPAVGDWAAVEVGPDHAIVRGVVARWSALARQDPLGDRVQVLAANVDLVLVTAPADRPSAARVEREIVIGWDSGARPVVVVTKADLDGAYVDELRERLVGVDVVATSVRTGMGVDAVADALRPHRTAVFLGPSGAGKSSLANALLGEDRLATGAVRDVDARGRHTTTSRELVVVPTGGVLIDTPGLRSLGLAGDGAGLAAGFGDIASLAEDCRFGDCGHEHEPDCAVLAAVEAGDLDPDRLTSYRKLEREQAFELRREDPIARQAEQRRWKAIHKAHRHPRKR